VKLSKVLAKLLGAILAACTLVLLGAASPVLAKDSLTLALQLEPPNLDPTSGAAVATDEVVYANIFEGLGAAGPRRRDQAAAGDLLGNHAPDGLTYTFHLRQGVRFQDGTPFDAGVAKFSLERAIAPGFHQCPETGAERHPTGRGRRSADRATAPGPA
jgi:peptide/nickel transport system substrate-binding protein